MLLELSGLLQEVVAVGGREVVHPLVDRLGGQVGQEQVEVVAVALRSAREDSVMIVIAVGMHDPSPRPATSRVAARRGTVGANGTYSLVSFKLNDAGKIDKLTLNGVMKDLTNNAWSDLNFVKVGAFGGVAGVNTLVVYDVAGNAKTLTFTLN